MTAGGQGSVAAGKAIHRQAASEPRSMSRVTPDVDASVCEATLRAYPEQLVMRHIFSCVEALFSAISLLSLCELIRAPV